MCLILDTNKYSDFFDPDNEDMAPIREWIGKKGKIAYSPTSQFEKELKKHEKMKKQIDVYREAGKLKSVSKEKVENTQRHLQNLVSNDPHIIALAKVSRTRLLVSGDKKLHKDFTQIIRGKVYQTKKHKNLLDRHSCQ